jgi:rhodanese-related sulfurtransferase
MFIGAVRIVTAEDYRRLVASGAVVMDLRWPLDYLDGHLDGALSCSGGRFLWRNRLAELLQGRPAVLIGRGPVDVGEIAEEMEQQGLEVVGMLTGTPASWKARGLPVRNWRRLLRSDWELLNPRPPVLDVREAAEPHDDWPEGVLIPLSTWTAAIPEPARAANQAMIVGPRPRAAWAAIRLFESGLSTVFCEPAATEIDLREFR